MEPGKISLRGHPIQELIGSISFPQMIWLMTRGNLPTKNEANLLECALVAAVDHGPQAPSIAAARMSVTCGLGMNGAMATAVNMLDDIHGGAGEQAIELYNWIDEQVQSGESLKTATSDCIVRWQSEKSKFIPGFGHRFHKPTDPRAPVLLAAVDKASSEKVVSGKYAEIGRSVQCYLNESRTNSIPMNIDGATAVIYAELGFSGPLARGLFCLSRSVGALAHAWEQMEQGGRNKGPTPPQFRWHYTGEKAVNDDV